MGLLIFFVFIYPNFCIFVLYLIKLNYDKKHQ